MSKDLFSLVKSLTVQEKRFFKIRSRQLSSGEKDKSNYILLFDLLDSMERYDENHLRDLVAGKNIGKFLSAEKNYLFEAILRAMQLYHQNDNSYELLNQDLGDLVFLEQKGLLSYSLRLAGKILEKAIRLEHFDQAAKAGQVEFQLALEQIANLENEQVAAMTERQDLYIAAAHYLNQLNTIQFRFAWMLRTMPSGKEAVDTLVVQAENLMKARPAIDSYRMDYHEQRVLFFMAAIRGQFQQAFHHNSIIIDYLEHHPVLSEQKNDFTQALANQMNLAYRLKRFDLMNGLLEKLSKVQDHNFVQQSRIFEKIRFFELLYYLNTLQLEKARQMEPEIQQGLKKFASRISKARYTAFCYNLLILFFVLEDFETALDWVNHIRQERLGKHRKDIQISLHLLTCIIYLEQENISLFDSQMLSTERLLKRQIDGPTDFQKDLVKLLKTLARLPEKNTKTKSLEIFLKKNNQDPSPGSTNDIPGYGESLIWAEARKRNVSLEEIYREKFSR